MNNRFQQALDTSILMVKATMWFLLGVLIMGAVGFEMINAFSTWDVLNRILQGDRDWVGALAVLGMTFAFVGSDLGGLARLFTPTTQSEAEPKIVWALFFIFLVVGLFNAFLTYTWFQWRMTNDVITFPGGSFVVGEVFPVVLAIVVYCVRIGYIYTLGVVLDNAMNHGHVTGTQLGTAVSSGSHQTAPRRSVPQNNRPMPVPNQRQPQVSGQSVGPRTQQPMPGRPGVNNNPSYHSLSGSGSSGIPPRPSGPSRFDPDEDGLP